MATLLNLKLSGIRSFGCSDELQQISFDTPVTLIVGQNGCGKTTILEAIKYACTSDLPGGTARGQGFVHDPKISEKSITKGQIRLKLTDVRGDKYTIVKCIQLQQKANTLSFSSLDSAISIARRNGEKQQITGRCADIDQHCAQVLQLSPCILNNVLFCHQENSSWPLDEGKKVKEKFDEIFDSKKYNKCAELLMAMIKTNMEKLKLLRLEVDNKKAKKLDVAERNTKLREKKEKCNSILESIREKTEALEPDRNRLVEIEALEVDLGGLQRQLTSKVTEKKGIAQQQNMLKENITFTFEGTDEELNTEISSFEQKQKEKEKLIKTLEDKKREIEMKENVNDAEIQKAQIKLGQLREEKKQYELKVTEQNLSFEKAKTNLEFGDDFVWNTPEDCRNALKLLQSKLNEVDEKLENVIKSKRDEESTMQEKIDEVREALAATKQKVQSNSNEIRSTDEKMIQITNEIQELDIANKKLVEIDKKIESLNRTLLNLQSKCDESKMESEIATMKKEINEMERKLEDLDEIYKVLQQNYVIEEKLNAEEQTQIKKKTEINKINNKHSNNFKHIFHDDIPLDKIGQKIQSILNANENQTKKINVEIASKQKEVTKLETQIQHQTQDLKKFQDELKSKQSQIDSMCQGKEFIALLKESFDKKERLQKDKGRYSSAQVMYEKFIEGFEKESACCPVCETNFSDKKSAVGSIIRKLQQKIKDIPEKLATIERELRKEEQFYNKLQQLKPVNENVELLSNAKIPLLMEQLESNKTNLNQLNEELSKLNADLKIPTKNLEICRLVVTDATLLDQFKAELKSCEERIEDLRSQKKNIESTKNKHEVESEIGNLKADLSDNRKKCETTRYKLDQHKQRCQKIREDKNKQLEMQMKYQTQSNKKPHLEKQLEELKDNYSVLVVIKAELQSELKKSDEELKSLSREKANLVNSNNKTINNEREIANKKHKLYDSIIKLNNEIKQCQDKNLTENIEQTIETLTQLQEKRDGFNEVRNRAVGKITQQKEEIAKQKSELRNLQDNVTLREKEKQEALLVIQINELEKRIGTYNYQTVLREKQALKRKIETSEKEINNLRGQEMELKNTISDIEHELNLKENKDAEKNYKEKFYEYKLTENVIHDLRTYSKALHYSILQFHKERMVQINGRIRELWREIYKGNDIDYIEIKAEESKLNNTKKQTYDYKVVQVKNSVELEMRGRCSAGQRVLACLIIRMALAESFSSHCGILALDEPTTNLDKENVRSLTSALANIIRSHQSDNNFQLLVITHDQEFLDILRHNVQNISHYWRVGRNPQGYSVINKERL